MLCALRLALCAAPVCLCASFSAPCVSCNVDVSLKPYSALALPAYPSPARAQAYLRKHRDESLLHQLHGFGDAALCKWRIPSPEEQRMDVRGVVLVLPPAVVVPRMGGVATASQEWRV
jgi:hypothetical protein